MKEIKLKDASERNLKPLGRYVGRNLSSTILLMQRLSEKKSVKYYIMESAIVSEETHNGEIVVSFWGDNE